MEIWGYLLDRDEERQGREAHGFSNRLCVVVDWFQLAFLSFLSVGSGGMCWQCAKEFLVRAIEVLCLPFPLLWRCWWAELESVALRDVRGIGLGIGVYRERVRERGRREDTRKSSGRECVCSWKRERERKKRRNDYQYNSKVLYFGPIEDQVSHVAATEGHWVSDQGRNMMQSIYTAMWWQRLLILKKGELILWTDESGDTVGHSQNDCLLFLLLIQTFYL